MFANHPELQEGEVFLTNAKRWFYQEIGWETKRQGWAAYDIHDDIIMDVALRPVFVQIFELETAGIDPYTLWDEVRLKKGIEILTSLHPYL